MKNLRLLILVGLLSMCPYMFAVWQPIVHYYSPQTYNAGTQNWQLMQARNGWMYACNSYGLLQYDGTDWNLYGVWHSSAVRCAVEGRSGRIYAGATNEFGRYTSDEYGQLTYESFVEGVPESYRNFGEVWHMWLDDDDSTMYVQTRNYLFVCNSSQVEVINPAATIYTSLFVNNTLYLATSNGVCVYAGNRLNMLQGSQQLAGVVVSGMVPYKDHSILIGTDFDGVFLYDGESIHPFQTEVDDFLKKNQLYSMAVSENSLAFGTVLHGVVVTNIEGGEPLFLDRSEGLVNSTVLSLCFDRDGSLWLGLDQGIACVMLSSPLLFLSHYRENYGAGYAYTEYGDARYYGTNQGLYVSTPKHPDLELVPGSLGQVWHMAKWNGHLFCCHNRGLFVVQPDGLHRLPTADGVWNILPSGLVCSYSGLYSLTQKGGQLSTRAISGYDDTMLFAEEDATGAVWTISGRGVERLLLNADRTSVKAELILPDPTRSLYRINRVDSVIYISAKDYLGRVGTDGFLQEVDGLRKGLDASAKYDFLAKDSASDVLVAMRHYQVEFSASDTSEVKTVFSSSGFFVGGFINANYTSEGNIVIGGFDGFYLINSERACQQAEYQPWEVRKVLVIVPWYKSWWAIMLYVLVSAGWLALVVLLVRVQIRRRDERISADKQAEIRRQETRIFQLEAEKAQFDLKSKSRELNSVLLNQVGRNEMLQAVQREVQHVQQLLQAGDTEAVNKALHMLDVRLSAGMKADKDWNKFEQNFDFVNNRFLRKLAVRYPWMSAQEKKLCVYIYMGLQTKEMAPLLNLSTRGVEMMRYRMRKKMQLEEQANMKQVFEKIVQEDV